MNIYALTFSFFVFDNSKYLQNQKISYKEISVVLNFAI